MRMCTNKQLCLEEYGTLGQQINGNEQQNVFLKIKKQHIFTIFENTFQFR